MRVELHATAVTSGPSYDNVQMLEDDEGLEFTVTGTMARVQNKDHWGHGSFLRGESGVFSTRFQSQFTQCSQILTGLYHMPYYSPY